MPLLLWARGGCVRAGCCDWWRTVAFYLEGLGLLRPIAAPIDQDHGSKFWTFQIYISIMFGTITGIKMLKQNYV